MDRQVVPVHDFQAGRHEPGSEVLSLQCAVHAERRQVPVRHGRAGLLHLTEYPQQVIELPGADGGLEQGQVGVAAGFDSWRQPQSEPPPCTPLRRGKNNEKRAHPQGKTRTRKLMWASLVCHWLQDHLPSNGRSPVLANPGSDDYGAMTGESGAVTRICEPALLLPVKVCPRVGRLGLVQHRCGLGS